MQAFLAPMNSVLRDAALVATSVAASEVFQRLPASRAGNGEVTLAGAYTGAVATTVEIEVVNGAGVPAATKPVFAGVGSGLLTVTAVDAAAPLQTITVTLADMGVDTATAQLDLGEATLRARAAGAAGNAIRLSVTPRLTRTSAAKSLLETWAASEVIKIGPQWDFGGLPLIADGQLDAASPRIAFGNDPAVYRPYRVYKDGAWQYGLSPALERTVERDTPVWLVSGDYEITVSDGAVTETYAAVTLYDMLAALAGSALVEVTGVVAADRAPGGASVIDVPIRTAAWVQRIDAAKKSGIVYEVVPGAPTEVVTLRCIEASAPGNELWQPEGAVLGAGLPFRTGVEAALDGRAARVFVPRKSAAVAVSGGVSWRFSPTSRSDEDPTPAVCLSPIKLGVNARAGRRVTFVYRKRPDESCSCVGMSAGRISNALLGLEGIDMGTLDPAVQTRLEQIYAWRRTFVGAQSGLALDPGAGNGLARNDLTWADRAAAMLLQGLLDVFEHQAALAEWDAAFTDVQQQATSIAAAGEDLISGEWRVDQTLRRHEAQMDYCRALAGILPKSDAGAGEGGGGVWRDVGDEYWWEDQAGEFLPAFNNRIYYSAKRSTGADGYTAGAIVNTREFAFGLVTKCDVRLKVGDQIEITIGDVSAIDQWRQGDQIAVSVIGAAPAWLAGGVDGVDQRTWRVFGSAGGPLPDYVLPNAGGAVWDGAGVTLAIAAGGIPFALGDSFRFDIEAGAFRWRRDGGAWSAAQPIPEATPAALADGLEAVFERHAAPGFVAGDRARIAVHQPHAPANVQRPGRMAWRWAGAAATLDADLGSLQTIGALAFAGHDWPTGATIALTASADGAAWLPLPAPDLTKPLAVVFLPASMGVRYLRLAVTNAAGGALGWVFAGPAFVPKYPASSVRLTRRWSVARGAGLNPGRAFRGAARGGEIAWEIIEPTDAEALLDLVEHGQRSGEPFVFVPSHETPRDAVLAHVDVDALDIEDFFQFQTGAAERAQSLRLPLAGVFGS